MQTEQKIAAHYSRGGLEDTIVNALAAGGHDVDKIVPSELAGADEFHLGWRQATVEFAKALAFPRRAHVLDIGSGIGGPARHFAEAYGVTVTGIDLTEDYVAAGNGLTRRCGLSDLVSFRVANALEMPFDAAAFDGAYTIHVCMNIAEKAKLFTETRRVLKPGSRLGVYDVMRAADGEIPYPMPWAATADISFVETPASYRQLLTAAGFSIESERDRGDFVRDLARQMREKAATEGPPRLGLHMLMGPATPERLGNVMKALAERVIAPVEIIAKAV